MFVLRMYWCLCCDVLVFMTGGDMLVFMTVVVMCWCLHCGGDVLVFMTVVVMWWCWCLCCDGDILMFMLW